MASRTCWLCKTSAHMTPLAAPTHTPVGDDHLWTLPCGCDNCGAASVATISGRSIGIRPDDRDAEYHIKEKMPSSNRLDWLPQLAIGKEFDDVPNPIADAASEAYACYSIRSYRAAILLARSVVEAVTKDKGATQGDLSKKINELADSAVITPFIKDTAHEIRYIGNEMAHGDFVEEVTEEECDDVLNFMSVLLDAVYQQPASLSRFKEARERRKAEGRS